MIKLNDVLLIIGLLIFGLLFISGTIAGNSRRYEPYASWFVNPIILIGGIILFALFAVKVIKY